MAFSTETWVLVEALKLLCQVSLSNRFTKQQDLAACDEVERWDLAEREGARVPDSEVRTMAFVCNAKGESMRLKLNLNRVATSGVFALVLSASVSHAEFATNWTEPFPEPPNLSAEDLLEFGKSMRRAERKLKQDRMCRTSSDSISATEIQATSTYERICEGRDGDIIYLASTRGLYLCSNGEVAHAMVSAIGSNGLGKVKEGDRKTPVGRYWLGLPRASNRYGIFIPVGYPNADDMEQGRTGTHIGIHGPLRFGPFLSACSGVDRVHSDWTAGCLAVGRDSQIQVIANWVLLNWPVQLEVINNLQGEVPNPPSDQSASR